MAPKHNNPTRKDRRALAPYNFVPIPDSPLVFRDEAGNPLQVDQSEYHQDRLTGWIDLDIETKSPVYVRGPLSPEQYRRMERQEATPNDRTPHLEKERNRPDFFHTGDPSRPAIPGSSLRGMLRNLMEILGHGKLQPIMDTQLTYRAVVDRQYREVLVEEISDREFIPRVQGGYIRQRDGEWHIQPAQVINGTSYARIHYGLLKSIESSLQSWHNLANAREIYVKIGPYEYQNVRQFKIKYAKVKEAAAAAGSLTKVVLAVTGDMKGKKSEAVVFLPDQAAAWIKIPDGSDKRDPRDLITAYEDQVTVEQEEILGSAKGVLQEWQPIFYLMDGSRLVFFGHTPMFRLPYENSPYNLLPPRHRSSRHIDLAEAIFGRIKDNETGEAGRIFFMDAQLEPGQENLWLSGERGIISQILSSPKPTTFQHYLTQEQPDSDRGQELYTYNNSRKKTTPRGYKLYWHKGDVDREDFADNLSANEQRTDTQHTRMRPVHSGVRFRGRLRFENLLPAEFGLLWWALTLPVEGEHYHKIGMGKPLGLGAIAITPRVEFVRSQTRYRSLIEETGDGWQWTSGQEATATRDQIVETSVRAFETLVSKKAGGVPFTQISRIQELLAMLSWPGPQPHEEHTRYMEIERPDPSAKRGKRNEYKERPVLPTPTAVLEQAQNSSGSRASARRRKPETAAAGNRFQEGTLKVWRGTYGFIVPDGGGDDVFVHQNQVEGGGPIPEGARVRFTIGPGRKGPEAKNVKIIK